MRRQILFGALVVLASATTAAAQLPLTGRALGLGGAWQGLARGDESVFTNPAHLALPGGPVWSFGLPAFALAATTSGFTLFDIPDIVNYDDLTPDQKQALLAKIPEEGSEIRLEARVPALTMQIGRVGFGVMYWTDMRQTAGKDLFDLLFNGYQEGRTDYDVGRTEGERTAFLDVAVATGQRLGPVAIGVTGHYLRGTFRGKSKVFEPRYDLANKDIYLDYVGVESGSGNGWSVDVGAAMTPLPGLVVSAAVANVATKLTWSEELIGKKLTLSKADLRASLPSLMERYDSSAHRIDPATATLQERIVAQGLLEEQVPPAILRLAIGWQPLPITRISAGYEQALTDGKLLGDWRSNVSVGVEQRLLFFTARAGLSRSQREGGEGRTTIGLGLGLGPLQVGVARLQDGAYAGADRGGWVVGFNLRAQGVLLSRPATPPTP